ncbi:YybH family protein [Seonamhaeicola maritimus]|uniref:Nuclear transport factor 2 family protein n=1 Tax=Seonamhaeicola maritimus TaxID=2591822 RepID=A0A5C7GGM1_9FLAO|nr:nuclear transport factor 2 family protein [Seonamhaeicola maritimus]TXG36662.1 nuclear transport factor 2 family protein [Seonamhaeicola maritimus]
MKKLLLILGLIVISISHGYTQNNGKNKEDIKAVLETQRLAWNKGDIKTYMEGYWKNDSLKFYGKSGITNGWKNTLDRYLKAYPSKNHTGELNFKINAISKITQKAYYVLGEYHLKWEIGNADGIFMLVFKKINGEWKIIADTSS